ncbi:Uncharacterised protein [Streptococcus pneumoniae]|nr:Uncharacterised protein [Streptococcus pneumoniae]
MCFTHSFFHFATFENLSNHVSVALPVGMVTAFVSFIYNLKAVL